MPAIIVPTFMGRLLEKVYGPLDEGDAFHLTSSLLRDRVEHSAAFQDQDQDIAYDEYCWYSKAAGAAANKRG